MRIVKIVVMSPLSSGRRRSCHISHDTSHHMLWCMIHKFYVYKRASYNKPGKYLYCNIEALSYKHCCSGKAISITYSECVFIALSIQHAMCIRHIFILVRPGLQYFSTLSHKRHISRKKVFEHKMWFVVLYNFRLTYFSF
jgi:hypothetical protein